MKKNLYGKGPIAAKAWILDDYVFVAMEAVSQRGDEEDLVRTYRLAFQESMTDTVVRR